MLKNRITDPKGQYFLPEQWSAPQNISPLRVSQEKAMYWLKQYEDTGLSPEDVKELIAKAEKPYELSLYELSSEKIGKPVFIVCVEDDVYSDGWEILKAVRINEESKVVLIFSCGWEIEADACQAYSGEPSS